jgi:hypothetical protein
MMMAEGAIMRRDLNRKRAHEFVVDHQVMPGLLLDGNHLFTGIAIVLIGSAHSTVLDCSLLVKDECRVRERSTTAV